MKIAVFGQGHGKAHDEALSQLLSLLTEGGAEVAIEANYLSQIDHKASNERHTFDQNEGLDASFDMLFSIGGDGTILRAMTYIKDLGIPVLGINLGRLGFLATVQREAIKEAVDQILEGRYALEERGLLSITESSGNTFGDFNFALNEITVSRKNTTSMIIVNTHLNDEYLTSYWADGLIIATPTGSTGYSLSCGGPVIVPNSNNLVLTPIAPHNLNARPLVISDDTVITLKVSGREENHLVSLDSRIFTLNNETEVHIKKASFTIKMVQLPNESFLKTLRNKMLWGQDKRN